jgi:hypothetical protein
MWIFVEEFRVEALKPLQVWIKASLALRGSRFINLIGR